MCFFTSDGVLCALSRAGTRVTVGVDGKRRKKQLLYVHFLQSELEVAVKNSRILIRWFPLTSGRGEI